MRYAKVTAGVLPGTTDEGIRSTRRGVAWESLGQCHDALSDYEAAVRHRCTHGPVAGELGESPGYWHDMMTGSNPDGTLANGDVTCGNWTGTRGHALVGHSDKGGRYGGDRATSWNSAHSSGKARFYCFAAE